MFKSKKRDFLYERIKKEFYCAYLYHKMGTSLSEMGLRRICKYMENQSVKKIKYGLELFDNL